MNSSKSPVPKLGIIIPCYNEEAALVDSSHKIAQELKKLIASGNVKPDSFVAFVDDGSKDKTWSIISSLIKKESLFKGLKLAGNVGHQNALYGGLMSYMKDADCLISIDADLQDDIAVMAQMVEKYREGSEVVYGVRSERGKDTFFKRFTAESYYKLLRFFGVKIVYNHADFRLLGSKALETFSHFREVNLFLRGMVPLLGYKSDIVKYSRGERLYGETKYSLRKMLKLAFDGVTSFSAVPLRIITVVGFCIFLLSILMSIYVVFGYVFMKVVSGWASIVLPLYLLGGVQLLAIGIIGEYLAKIYVEIKDRPRFVIEEKI